MKWHHLKFFGGLIVAFGSLWIGAWAIRGLTYKDWQEFPAMMSLTLLVAAGCVLTINGFYDWSQGKRN